MEVRRTTGLSRLSEYLEALFGFQSVRSAEGSATAM